MPLINNDLPTLLDHAKAKDPDGSIARVVELMSRRNVLIQDAVFQEGNLETGHRVTSRVGLPSVGFRRLNQGIESSKSIREQFDEATGMLEGMSEVDIDLAALGGNAAAFRASEDDGFIQSMSNRAEQSLFYASTATDPEEVTGLTPRFNSLSGRSGSQVIPVTASASGNDQASMWAVVWGKESVFGIFPKGSKAGLDHQDMGVQYVTDANNKKFRAYVTHWQWKFGLCVKDYRQVVRACNIDLSVETATNDTLIPALINMHDQIHDPNAGKLVFYVPRRVHTLLWLQARNATKNSTLSVMEVEGKPVLTFNGYPIRRSDALLATESVVS